MFAVSLAGPRAAADQPPIDVVAVASSRNAGDDAVAQAVAAALEDLNRAGGLLGRTIRIAREDDRCTREGAARVAHAVAARKPAVVIGHPCAPAAVTAAAIYRTAKLLAIMPGVRHAALTPRRPADGIVRLAGRDDRQGADIAALLAARFPGRRAAVVHDKSRRATDLARAIMKATADARRTLPLVLAYTAGEKDYTAIAARLAAERIDVVVLPAQPVEAGIILDAARERGLRLAAVGGDALAATADAARLAGLAAPLIVMQPIRPLADARGCAPGPADPGRWARAAVALWAAAVRRAGATDGEVVRVALAMPSASGFGPVAFDDDGDARLPGFVPCVWRDGAWRPADGTRP